MKILILSIILTTSSFGHSHQQAFCESSTLSKILPKFATNLIDRSELVADGIHLDGDFNPRDKDILTKKIQNFEYLELCEDKDTMEDFDTILGDKLNRGEYISEDKELNPKLECLSVIKSDSYWEELRRKQARALCEGLKESVSSLGGRKKGLDCNISDLGVIDFEYVNQLYTEKSPKKQCLFILKQIREVIEAFRSK